MLATRELGREELKRRSCWSFWTWTWEILVKIILCWWCFTDGENAHLSYYYDVSVSGNRYDANLWNNEWPQLGGFEDHGDRHDENHDIGFHQSVFDRWIDNAERVGDFLWAENEPSGGTFQVRMNLRNKIRKSDFWSKLSKFLQNCLMLEDSWQFMGHAFYCSSRCR